MELDSSILNHLERRNYRRLLIELNVTVQSSGQELIFLSQNISCGGVFLSGVGLKASTELDIILNLPAISKPVRVSGEVARLGLGTAIQFRGLYDEHRLILDQFIKEQIH